MEKLSQLGQVRVDHHMQTVRAVSLFNSLEKLTRWGCFAAGERHTEHVSLQSTVRGRGLEPAVYYKEPSVGFFPDRAARGEKVYHEQCRTRVARKTVSH